MADEEGKGEITVPKDRLDREIAAKRVAQTRVGELEGKLSEIEQQHASATERAKTADTLAAQVEALKSEHAIAAAAWAEERGIYQAGITDPEAIDVARVLHGKIPKKDRPALGDWLGSFREDPSKAPRALQPYLGQPAGQQQAAEPPKPPGGGAAGKQQATGQPATGGQLSAESIKALRLEAAKSGDYQPLKDALQQWRGEKGLPQHS